MDSFTLSPFSSLVNRSTSFCLEMVPLNILDRLGHCIILYKQIKFLKINQPSTKSLELCLTDPFENSR